MKHREIQIMNIILACKELLHLQHSNLVLVTSETTRGCFLELS